MVRLTRSPVCRPGAPRQDARARLICLPPAGASASTFYPLLDLDSTMLEICPVALPGREDRFAELLPDSIDALADLLAKQLRPLLDRPYAILGYSMGALLGWELAKRWRDSGERQPDTLFALAARAPHRPYGDKQPLHKLDSQAFRNALVKLGGMPAELLQQPEVMAIYEPVLRNDLRNCETHPQRPAAALDCPIHALVGVRDALVSVAAAEAWRQHTARNFQLHLLDSQHILTRDQVLRAGRKIIHLWHGEQSR
jgi:surfactin synthase thioesterase subunit